MQKPQSLKYAWDEKLTLSKILSRKIVGLALSPTNWCRRYGTNKSNSPSDETLNKLRKHCLFLCIKHYSYNAKGKNFANTLRDAT